MDHSKLQSALPSYGKSNDTRLRACVQVVEMRRALRMVTALLAFKEKLPVFIYEFSEILDAIMELVEKVSA